MCVRPPLLVALALAAAATAGLPACAADADAAPTASGGFDRALQPYLETYCLRYHGEKKPKGDFRPREERMYQ